MKQADEKLEIIVNNEPVEVKEFISYAHNQQFFAVGTNGHLYYPNYRNEKVYDLLKEDFTTTSNYRK